MVCPVCVVGGIGFVLSRIFGFPDAVVSFVTGMMSTSTAYWVNHILTKRWSKRKGQLVVINILSGIMFLYSLKWIGLW
jgi:ABC-type iron transport system FetAB permease component